MPKIPLYNEGRGQAVGLATGSLGPRASSAAFEAPSQAMARLGGQVSQIAFEFGMREKQQQTKAAILDYETSIKEEAKDFIRNDTSTYTSEFEGKFNTFKADRLDRIKNDTSLTNSQKTAVQLSVESMLAHQTLVGKQESHNRGLMRNGQVYMKTLDSNQKMMATLDTSDPAYMRMDAQNKQIFADAMLTGIKLPTTEQGFYAGLQSQRTVIDITSAVETGNKAGLEAVRADANQRLKDGDLLPTAHAKVIDAVNKGNKAINAKNYDQNLGLIGEAAQNMTRQEADAAIKSLQAGDAITVTTADGEFTIDPKDMGNQNTMVLSSKLAGLTKEIYDEYAEQQANNIADVLDGDPREIQNNLRAALNELQGTDEERADVVLTAAANIVNDAERGRSEGTISSTDYENQVAFAESLIASPLGIGIGAINERVDSRGKSANTILAKISDGRKSINTAMGKVASHNQLVSAMGTGDFGNFAYNMDAKPSQVQDAIDAYALTSKSPVEFINTLALENLTSTRIKDGLQQGLGLAQSTFDFDGAGGAEMFQKVDQSFAVMDLMASRGGKVLSNHLTPKEITYYNSVKEYQKFNPDLRQAINLANIAASRTDDQKTAGRKAVKSAVDAITSELGNTGFFGIGDTDIQNKGIVRNDLEQRAKLYADLGHDADKSLELAKADLADEYILVGNMLITETKTMPKDIDQLSKYAAQLFFDMNPSFDPDDYDVDENNFSLVEMYPNSFQLYMDGRPISTDFAGSSGTKYDNNSLARLREAFELDEVKEREFKESAETLEEEAKDATIPEQGMSTIVDPEFLSPEDMQMQFAGQANTDKISNHYNNMFSKAAEMRGQALEFITTEQPMGGSQMAVPSEAE